MKWTVNEWLTESYRARKTGALTAYIYRALKWPDFYAKGGAPAFEVKYGGATIALIRFEGGATGRVGVSVEAEMPYVFHLQVNGTKGAIRQKGVYSPELYPGAKDFVSLPESYPDDWNVAGHPFGAEIDDFVEAVCSGRPGQLDFAHARKTYDLLFAIERAAAQNSTVALSRGRGDFCMPY